MPQVIKDSDRWMRLPTTELVADLTQVLGAPMVAVIGRAKDTRSVRGWQTGEYPPKEEARLRFAIQVIDVLASRWNADAIRAWFSGVNIYLEDQNPALLIASTTDFGVRKQVLAAARQAVTA